MRKQIFLALLWVGVLLVAACAPVAEPTADASESVEAEPALPETVEIRDADHVPRVTPQEAKALVESGNAVLMDSRSQDSYDVQHISGALPRPTVALSQLGEELDPEQTIIVYCT